MAFDVKPLLRGEVARIPLDCSFSVEPIEGVSFEELVSGLRFSVDTGDGEGDGGGASAPNSQSSGGKIGLFDIDI